MTHSSIEAEKFVHFVRDIYGMGPVALHRPVFEGNEKTYLCECIDSNYVSSVGERVGEFERMVSLFAGSAYGVAMVNGTSALHLSMVIVGVRAGDEVITQPFTFVATCNAISYIGANPVFVDIDPDTLGMSATSLQNWLKKNTRISRGVCYNKTTGSRITACIPMHTFGFPCRIREIAEICRQYKIALVEDSAESLGSYVGGKHTGTFGRVGALSFNGNKIVTTGGGGMIVTDDEELAVRAKHLSTTAKIPHKWDFVHDQIGYNYRLPNLNAALGCAQMEMLPLMLKEKRKVAESYAEYFEGRGIPLISELSGTSANYWLNAIKLRTKKERDEFLSYTNESGIMTRPVWKLMSSLKMFKGCQRDDLKYSIDLSNKIVNIPSSVPSIVRASPGL